MLEFASPKDRIILALDVNSVLKGIEIVEAVGPEIGVIKIGLEFENLMQADLIAAQDFEVREQVLLQRRLYRAVEGKHFADKKLHDIPNTLGRAMKQIARWHPKMVTVHSSTGISAMKEIVANKGSVMALAVTVLTSLDEQEVFRIFNREAKQEVLQLARDAVEAGMDGIVCSPRELEFLHAHPELRSLRKATPSIRSKDAPPDDQKRTMTAAEAIRAGADYLVIGRPITQAPEPVEAAKRFAEEIAAALQEMRS